jgi:NTE family protein
MTLGLALGGGGARGAAHVGVLQELYEMGIRPDLVTGTSIGGLVGALVAAGLSTAEMADTLESLSFNRIYSLPGRKPALVNNQRLEKLLVKKIGRPTFADLEIPLAVVVTDLVRREEVVLSEGDVVSAVLATTAFPIALPPIEREGRMLVDGGILNNTPFDVAYHMWATAVLAIDLSNSAPYGTPIPRASKGNLLTRLLTLTSRQPLYQTLATTADILTAANVEARRAARPPTVLLRPDIGTLGLFEFHRTQEGISVGRETARAAADELAALMDHQSRASGWDQTPKVGT